MKLRLPHDASTVESAAIHSRTVGKRRLLRDAGWHVEGLPPVGYKRGRRNADGIKPLIVQADGAAKVRAIFAACIAGCSVSAIAEHIGEQRDRVFDVLKNRLYLGQLRNTSGDWIPAKHAPLVDAHVFDAAQAALKVRHRTGYRAERPDVVAVMGAATAAPMRRLRRRRKRHKDGLCWPVLRRLVVERDGWTCQCCGTPLTPCSYECGHIVDRASGGVDALSNLVAMCAACNRRKPIHNSFPAFLAWVLAASEAA